MSFETQPLLKGRFVVLRPLCTGDYEELFSVAADPLIWEQHSAKDRHREPIFRDFFDEALASGGALTAIDARSQRIIGTSRFHGYNEERSEVEIGWTFLARSYWGGAFNGEMKQLMLDHAFQFVRHVLLIIDPGNLRSQRAAMKIGAVRIASRPGDENLSRYVYRISSPAHR